MYLSRIELRSEQGTRSLIQNEYGVHQALWSLFADHADRRRDFIYRKHDTQPLPVFYAVSKRPPKEDTRKWKVQTKTYAPHLQQGDVLEFSLRVNPVRTIKDANGRQKRVDVVMDEKYLQKQKQDDPASLAERMRMAGLKWLDARAEKLGFEYSHDRLRVDGYCIQTFFKAKKNAKKNRIRFATLDFEGQITVQDPQAMLNTLYYGIGPAKAFGCGLMLVRRARCSPD
ncbi:MAG: type I-E CRISPR-associated protein Cas6/Cse3/CasE [Desulfovermiculus sp.]